MNFFTNKIFWFANLPVILLVALSFTHCAKSVRHFSKDTLSYDRYAPALQSGMEQKFYEFYTTAKAPQMITQIIFEEQELEGITSFSTPLMAIAEIQLPAAGEQFPVRLVKRSFEKFNQLCLQKIQQSRFQLAQLAHQENAVKGYVHCLTKYESR